MGSRVYTPSIGPVNGEEHTNPDIILSGCNDPDCYGRHPTEVSFDSRRGLHFRRGGELAIMIDGSCLNNGSVYARAGVGVYFDHNSPLNISQPIRGFQTSQRAEIHAAIIALKKVKEYQLDIDEHLTGVVLISDSANLVNAMTRHINTWSRNYWRNRQGRQVANAYDFRVLEGLVRNLETRGFPVRFWYVPRTYNYHADRLAKSGVFRSGVGGPASSHTGFVALPSATPRPTPQLRPPLNYAHPRHFDPRFLDF
ncbi:ribonuclease H-like protein [Macrolepiota fuliginosa MF-IS2]|uniref:ribonuclease H n=1 Tax=Macrolepiota fuliginosa MF-IS2 TaxID=1400762 RepID=A0A9P5XA43_9AGAR|nr:ribonuclease H-like protein [Macrolepiota fuliginosa MF-IS2]